MPTSRAQIDLLEEHLEGCLNSDSGVYLIECSPKRAKYFQNVIRRITRLSVYESLQIYHPTEPLYGRSIYRRIITKVVDHGLYLIRVPEPTLDPPLVILDAAITNEERRIHPATKKLYISYQVARSRLMREEALPPDMRRKIGITAIALSDDTISIQPASIGHVIREIPREELAALIRSAQLENDEENSFEPLDNEPPIP